MKDVVVEIRSWVGSWISLIQTMTGQLTNSPPTMQSHL